MSDKEMSREEISTLVKEYAFKYLRREGMLKDFQKVEREKMDKRLSWYYGTDEEDSTLKAALKEIEKDIYFPIIEMYYRDYSKIESIAADMNISDSTVKRNKSRLLTELCKLCID